MSRLERQKSHYELRYQISIHPFLHLFIEWCCRIGYVDTDIDKGCMGGRPDGIAGKTVRTFSLRRASLTGRATGRRGGGGVVVEDDGVSAMVFVVTSESGTEPEGRGS